MVKNGLECAALLKKSVRHPREAFSSAISATNRTFSTKPAEPKQLSAHILSRAGGFEEEYRTYLNEIAEDLRDRGLNAFLADEVPPFNDEREVKSRWFDTCLANDEVVVTDFDFSKQSRLYATIGDMSTFVFTYFGNPTGTAFEIADIFRYAISSNEERILRNSFLCFQQNVDLETELRDEYGDDPWRDFWWDIDRPHYLSAMLSELVDNYSQLDVKWADFSDKDGLIDLVSTRADEYYV